MKFASVMSEKDISISSSFGVMIPVDIDEFGVTNPPCTFATSFLMLREFRELRVAMVRDKVLLTLRKDCSGDEILLAHEGAG
jgi:hypothetical protein